MARFKKVAIENEEIIFERLQHAQKTVTTTQDTVFSSDVSESKMRFIVNITIQNPTSSAAALDISKVTESDTYSTIFPWINVGASSNESIPLKDYDIMSPIITLEGGTNLGMQVVSGTTLYATITYWDNEI